MNIEDIEFSDINPDDDKNHLTARREIKLKEGEDLFEHPEIKEIMAQGMAQLGLWAEKSYRERQKKFFGEERVQQGQDEPEVSPELVREFSSIISTIIGEGETGYEKDIGDGVISAMFASKRRRLIFFDKALGFKRNLHLLQYDKEAFDGSIPGEKASVAVPDLWIQEPIELDQNFGVLRKGEIAYIREGIYIERKTNTPKIIRTYVALTAKQGGGRKFPHIESATKDATEKEVEAAIETILGALKDHETRTAQLHRHR